jgi:hypothetical protein
VDEINARMIDIFPGKAMVFYSFDSVDDDECNNYPQDFLNSITPNGLPPHELSIKINCPLILLHNLDPRSGLCNGTHLVVRAVDKHILDAEIVNGTHAGDRAFIPRILLSPSEDLSIPFKSKRKQFPVRLSFVMTINKAQARQCQLLVYIYRNQSFHMGNYMLLYRGVCLEDPPGFYVNLARKLIPKAIALKILCILTSFELDGVRISFYILFVNRLVIFRFIELYCFIKFHFCYQTSLVT